MNIVNGFDIDTPEGAEAYLRSEGVDIEECVKDGMDIIERTKKLVSSNVKESFSLIDKKDPKFEILFRENGNWSAYDHQLTDMMRELVARYNKMAEYLNAQAKNP